jgi:hypothetical protein
MRINIETIPHPSHRYETVGDWWIDRDGTWQIRVSEMSDWRYCLLVAFHELSEMAQCEQLGIKEEDISAFDIQFEKERSEGRHAPEEEPGDAENAPYRKQHFIATNVERQMSDALGVNWASYDNEVINL